MEQLQNSVKDLEKQLLSLKEENKLLIVEKNINNEVISNLEEANSKIKTQAALSNILQLTALDEKLEVLLQKALDEILQIPWLLIQSKGSIFLTNSSGNIEMVAQKGLSDEMQQLCNTIEPNQCLCGKTLSSKEYLFKNHIDDDHDIRPEDMIEHGHYNFPLLYDNEALGVLSIYIDHNHEEKEVEVQFFRNVSLVLANLIHKHRIQNKISDQAQKQSKINQKLFAQNLEIDQQRVEIQSYASNLEKAKDEIQKNKEIIEKSHKSITDSINYAKNLQNGLLPTNKIIDKWLNNYFILFKPRDVVSGDFYYVNKVDDYLIIVVADCTGHGVSGAFLSILGITYINKIIKKKEVWTPAQALDTLRDTIKESFQQFGSESNMGMDMAFCAINTKTNVMQYAGANNPLFIFRNNELIEYGPTKNPIGAYPREKSFENNEIQLHKDDMLYLFSDGYQDQFGGENKKKYLKKNFRNLLFEIHSQPLQKQKEILDKAHLEWKNTLPQTDDIVIFGVKY